MTDGDDPDTELDLKLPDMTVMPSAPRHTPLELADEEPALELARPVGRARIDGGTREIVPDAPDGPDPELGRDITRKRQSQPFHIPRSLVKLLLLSLLVAAGFAIAFLRPEWLDEAKTRLSEGVEAVRPLMPEALKLPQPDDMVTIAAADFARGCLGDDTACGEDERPPELMTMPELAIDKTEVTAAAYAKCVAAKKCTTPGKRDPLCAARRTDVADLPINCVDADQAAAYCASRGKRLPTAAEWEFAARGGKATLYAWGSDAPTCARANHDGCGGKPVAVGGHESPLGLSDLAGNVWEWTTDGKPVRREIRGGSYLDVARTLRTSNRGWADERTQIPELGFRCVR